MARPSGARGGESVGRSALHVVSAWAVENRLTLGQVATDAKSNEITAIPELLALLDLKGAVVTIDAMGCQKEIAAEIINGEGHYLLAVKENQPHLYEDIGREFDEGAGVWRARGGLHRVPRRKRSEAVGGRPGRAV